MPSYTDVYKNPQGPGDARPTALQIVKDNDLVGKLQGKVALITGASSGIGVETARALKTAGMLVFGAVRNLEKAQAALKDDLEPGHLELLKVDMNSLASVRACAGEFPSKSNQLHILVNNAGVMITPEGKTADGFELQFDTNHLAHFLLFQLLKPTLLASATPEFSSRVISLSSVVHRGGAFDFSDPNEVNFTNKPYDPVAAYSQSKLATLYMANEIDRRYGAANLHAFNVMPGGIWTGLQASLPDEVTSMWHNDEEFIKRSGALSRARQRRSGGRLQESWRVRVGYISRTVRLLGRRRRQREMLPRIWVSLGMRSGRLMRARQRRWGRLVVRWLGLMKSEKHRRTRLRALTFPVYTWMAVLAILGEGCCQTRVGICSNSSFEAVQP
jgi:NAD(P)-dependent dehydrogenase (short-subunit alcohol dehydrogenase family)